MSALAALARYVRPRGTEEASQCEICAARLAEQHAHVVDTRTDSLRCACAACVLLFRGNDAHFRLVPEHPRRDPSFVLTRGDLESLGAPVGLAFCCLSSKHGRWLMRLPSPAGAVEAELDEKVWSGLLDRSAFLQSIAPDVEALLVYARRSGEVDCLVAPLDVCYELAGLVRRHYRGFSGGDAAHQAFETFFQELRARSRLVNSDVEKA